MVGLLGIIENNLMDRNTKTLLRVLLFYIRKLIYVINKLYTGRSPYIVCVENFGQF